MNIKRINLFAAMVMIMAIATTSLISCGGGGNKDGDTTDPDVTGGSGCAAGEAEKLELLSGTWSLDSISQDEKVLVQPLAGAISLTFSVDTEECENNTFSVSGGEYLLADASDVAFAFVANTDFLRMTLGDVTVRIESVDASSLVISFDYEDPNDESSRVLRTGNYVLMFSK